MPHEPYKKIAVVGASGTLGSAVLQELIESRLFEITVLTRETSSHTFPPEVKVTKVNFESLDSLTEALTGLEVIVSTVATTAIASQNLLIDAAVKAGIKRIIPSEFGCDIQNPKVRALPVYAGKIEIEDKLKEIAESKPVSYTLIYNGPFLDSGLQGGLFLNFKERKINLYDGGDQLISVSRLSTVGKAVRRVLTHPRETVNRAIWVKDIDVSQKQLLKLAQALTPGEEWQVTEVNTADLEKQSLEQLATNNIQPTTFLNLIFRAIFSPDFGNLFKHNHNAVLGIRGLEEKDLVGVARDAFAWEAVVNSATDGPYIS